MQRTESAITNYASEARGVAGEPREIAPRIWWLPHCLEVSSSGVDVHIHNSPFLLLGEHETLLWDTGPPAEWPQVLAGVQRILNGRQLDWVAPSHPEVPHCGNLGRLLAEYPSAHVPGDVRDYHLLFPEFAERLVPLDSGARLDLGGLSLQFLDAVIKDLPNSQWAYEASQRVLFVADAFSYSHLPPLDGDDRRPHLPGQCTLMSSELGAVPTPDDVLWITRAALYWTRFVDMAPYRASMRRLLDKYPTSMLAPAHGQVIDDLDRVMPAIWDAIGLAYNPEHGVAAAGKSARDRPAAT